MIVNYVWLVGEDFDLARFRAFVTSGKSEMDFEKIIPQPSRTLGAVSSDWNQEHWGTTREALKVRWFGNSLIDFETKKTAPTGIYAALVSGFPKIKFSFSWFSDDFSMGGMAFEKEGELAVMEGKRGSEGFAAASKETARLIDWMRNGGKAHPSNI